MVFLMVLIFFSGLYTIFFYSPSREHFSSLVDSSDNTDIAGSSGSSPSNIPTNCPNLLIQKGSSIYLKNTKQAEVPGVNPIQFANLEEYSEFMAWQKSQGITCPVLVLQHSYDTQGKEVYKVRPDINDPQGGLNPASPPKRPPTMDPSYNGQQVINDVSGGAIPTDHINPVYNPFLYKENVNPSMLVDATFNPPYNQNEYPAYDSSSYYVGRTTPLDQMNHANDTMLQQSTDAMAPNWGGSAYTQSAIDRGDFSMNEVSLTIQH